MHQRAKFNAVGQQTAELSRIQQMFLPVFKRTDYHDLLLRWAGPHCSRFGVNIEQLLYPTLHFVTDMWLRFAMRVAQRRVGRKSKPNFALFDPRKNQGGVGKNAEWEDQVGTTAERFIYI